VGEPHDEDGASFSEAEWALTRIRVPCNRVDPPPPPPHPQHTIDDLSLPPPTPTVPTQVILKPTSPFSRTHTHTHTHTHHTETLAMKLLLLTLALLLLLATQCEGMLARTARTAMKMRGPARHVVAAKQMLPSLILPLFNEARAAAPHVACPRQHRMYTELTSVPSAKEGQAPFSCIKWHGTPGTTTAEALTVKQKATIQGQSLGGNGYAGDKRFSANLNKLLTGRPLLESIMPISPPFGSIEGWEKYGGTKLPWRDQILTFGKELAEIMNQMPDTPITVYRGGWESSTRMEQMLDKKKRGLHIDDQENPGFTSTTVRLLQLPHPNPAFCFNCTFPAHDDLSHTRRKCLALHEFTHSSSLRSFAHPSAPLVRRAALSSLAPLADGRELGERIRTQHSYTKGPKRQKGVRARPRYVHHSRETRQGHPATEPERVGARVVAEHAAQGREGRKESQHAFRRLPTVRLLHPPHSTNCLAYCFLEAIPLHHTMLCPTRAGSDWPFTRSFTRSALPHSPLSHSLLLHSPLPYPPLRSSLTPLTGKKWPNGSEVLLLLIKTTSASHTVDLRFSNKGMHLQTSLPPPPPLSPLLG
jgi:hypothetical protein